VKPRFLVAGANSDIAREGARLLVERGAEVVDVDIIEPKRAESFASFALIDLSEPEAHALVSVACDLTHMTGQTLVVDGGQLVARE